jgi:hypothetical protein
LDVYLHIPVRNALGYEKLKELQITDRAREYLLKTEFDFVVCDHSASPILAIEFDGLGHGFSRDGKYVQVVETEDQNRKLKLDAKINACELCGLPIVVVSYPETESVNDPDCPVTILDAVIGEVVEGLKRQELVNLNLNQLGESLESDPSRETAEMLILEIETMAEEENPIKRKIRQMHKELPVSFGLQIYPLHDRPGYIGARQTIDGGIMISRQKSQRKVLLSYDVYVRSINCMGCDAFNLANLLAEYGLAKKAIRVVGKSPDAWRKLQEETPWTEW